jgi:hypothetical protein
MSAGGPARYPRCQAWAAALHEAGYEGIRYRARHDPALGTTSYAIFGTPGLDEKVFAPASTFPVPAEWIDELAHRYGFRIVPRNSIL